MNDNVENNCTILGCEEEAKCTTNCLSSVATRCSARSFSVSINLASHGIHQRRARCANASCSCTQQGTSLAPAASERGGNDRKSAKKRRGSPNCVDREYWVWRDEQKSKSKTLHLSITTNRKNERIRTYKGIHHSQDLVFMYVIGSS